MSSYSNDYTDLVYLCAFNILFGGKPRLGHAIIENLGSAKTLFELGKTERKRLFPYGSKYPFLINDELIEIATKELDMFQAHGIKFITSSDTLYPTTLKDSCDHPLCLYSKGNAELFNKKSHVFVSINGLDCFDTISINRLKDLFEKLSKHQLPIVIISNLSVESGQDILSSCLQYGMSVIGVRDTSLDYLWRGFSTDAERQIIESGRGLIISDKPCNDPFRGYSATERSWRLIAGLSQVLILIKSDIKSQSTGIFKLAHSYGKELYAYLSRIEDRNACASNFMICKNMAQGVCSTEDFLNEINHFFE